MQQVQEEVQITPNLIKVVTGHFDLESVRILKLNHLQIRRIETVHFCQHLEHLNLSNNHLRSMKGIEELTQLKHLDLSYNQIEHFFNIDKLQNLRFLNLQNNQLDTIEELKILLLLPLLQDANFKNNPICKVPNYETQIREMIPQALMIDGEHKTIHIILNFDHNKPIDLSKADIDPEIYTPWTRTSKGEYIFKSQLKLTEIDQKFETERKKFQSQVVDCQKLLSAADALLKQII